MLGVGPTERLAWIYFIYRDLWPKIIEFVSPQVNPPGPLVTDFIDFLLYGARVEWDRDEAEMWQLEHQETSREQQYFDGSAIADAELS